MTAPERPEVQRARDWSAALAAALDDVTGQVGAVARQLADGWTDARGQEWTERLLLLRHELARDADAADELGLMIDRIANDDPAVVENGIPPTAPSGPQLGGTAARRVDDRRGVTIPRLNDPADGPG